MGDGANPPVNGARTSVGMDDQVYKKPYGPPDGVVVFRAPGDHQASPDEPPPISRSRLYEGISCEDRFDVL